MSAPPLFRKAALERLSSPERLDELMQVTRPRAWLALVALGLVVIAGFAWSVWGSVSSSIVGEGILMRAGGRHAAVVSSSGRVVSLEARAGELVPRGATLAVIAVDGEGEVAVPSPVAGRVLDVRVRPDQLVEAGAVLASLEPDGAIEAVTYFSPHEGRAVHPGMHVELLPANVIPQDSGYLLGVVRSVSRYPATRESMRATLGAPELADRFAAGGPPYEVRIDLVRDPSRNGGLRWSSAQRPPVVESGTFCTARVITRRERPIDLVLPGRASPRAVSGR